ncbi:MAG: SufB/SufD family protein [Syntrophomonadaceae bacterium]
MNFDKLDLQLLETINNMNGLPEGPVNIRRNGETVFRRSSPHILVQPHPSKSGLYIEVKPGTIDEIVHIPVLVTTEGLKDKVYNTFVIGENSRVTVMAGCGIHNDGSHDSVHEGNHEIIVKAGAHLKYMEKHYGQGQGSGKRVLTPSTSVILEKGASCEMELVQIRGVDDSVRSTVAHLQERTSLKIIERLLTHGDQVCESSIEVFIEGIQGNAQILSRSVAQDNSRQSFRASLVGAEECRGHVECDSIIMGNAKIKAVPQLVAENSEAVLTHEAAIGKIAGEQLIKLMSLGLSEKEAIDAIIEGFLR